MTAFERWISDEERRAVIDELGRLGRRAVDQYPGVVSIETSVGVEPWTGMHAWDYASWLRFEDDVWQPIEDSSVEGYEARDHGLSPAHGPAGIALAWHTALTALEEDSCTT